MAEERPEPTFLRPWFYRPEYFVPAFFFPPVWSVLVLRSPWNQNIIVGGVAWAIIFIAGFLALKWIQNGSVQNVLVLFLPGILLTVITQVQWERFRSVHKEGAGGMEPLEPKVDETGPSRPATPRSPSRPTARRRSAKRRGQR